ADGAMKLYLFDERIAPPLSADQFSRIDGARSNCRVQPGPKQLAVSTFLPWNKSRKIGAVDLTGINPVAQRARLGVRLHNHGCLRVRHAHRDQTRRAENGLN